MSDPSVAVQRAGLEDLATLARLRTQWAEERAGGPVDDDGFADAFTAWFEREHEQRVTWLADAGGRPVGMLNMLVFSRMPMPDDATTGRATRWGYVANVYVEAAARDRGIGAALLDACVRHAQERGFARLVLSPSDRSVPFYLRAGFEPATGLMVRPLP